MIKRILRVFSIRSGASFLLAAGLLVTLTVVFWIAWGKWGPAITQGKKYKLDLEQITVSRPPEWIHVDVKSAVYRDGSLGELSILDSRLAVKVARAFELNPWVSRVKWVRKSYPGQVEVELEYRRPVAMVEVHNADQMGLLPIDSQAILLEPRDFSENMAQRFLRIRADYRYPIGAVGTMWEDKRIIEAAAVAEALLKVDWRQIGIHRIVAATADAGAGDGNLPHEFYLLTPDDLKIHWGRAPGKERETEPPAVIKIQWLEELARVKGRLSRSIIHGELDLRHADRIKVVAPTVQNTSGQLR